MPELALDISVVAPAHNERENIRALVEQVGEALKKTGFSFEFVIIDDGSTDGTGDLVESLLPRFDWLRLISMADTPPGRGHGQSAAFHAGFRATRGALIVVLDADLQNDPADIAAMLDVLREENADMVQGDRSHNRRDGPIRRVGSVVGRCFRRAILGDSIRDTGCSLRVMKREIALRLPLEFRGMHRFIPISARQMGFKVVEMRVHHRARTAGETKYGMGIVQRALPGLIDCFAVRYLGNRRRAVTSFERTNSETSR